MIIDFHTRLWSAPDQLGPTLASRLRARRRGLSDVSPEMTEADLLRQIACVDAAVVHGFHSGLLEAEIPNELIGGLVSRHPDRFVGFAGIDPLAPDALAELERAASLGLAGISVSPSMQGFHPSHSSAMRVYEACAAMGMPVAVSRFPVSAPQSVLEFDRPTAWDEVVRTFPDLRLVLGALGHPSVAEALTLVEKHEHVFADISLLCARPWQLFNVLLDIQAMGVLDRILFASGAPFVAPEKAIETIYSLNAYSHGTQLPSISRALLREIVERDALAALGVEWTGGGRSGARSIRPSDALPEATIETRTESRGD